LLTPPPLMSPSPGGVFSSASIPGISYQLDKRMITLLLEIHQWLDSH